MSSSSPNPVETATAALEQEETANGLLRRTADELVSLFDARACVISRVIGDLLLEVTQSSAGELIPTAGHGYLLSDYPLTQEAIDVCQPRLVSLRDENPEPSEAALLKELQFDSLLMLPMLSLGSCWGLIEVYANGRQFSNEEAKLAETVVTRAGQLLEGLPEYRDR